jgi:pimeloyl-ACP methyl ester carboxylesterase
MTRILAAILSLIAFFASGARAAEVWETLPPTPAMPVAVETGYAPVNGIEMYYAIYGSGEPLILLHGGLGHSDVWGNQIPELAKTHKVIALDSRGHGRSSRNADPYSYALMAKDVVAAMDYLKIDKASILGWSDGGIIGLDIAINYPDRLNRLYAFGANTNVAGLKPNIDKNATFNAYIERMAGDYKRLSKTPTEFEAFVTQIGQMWATQPDYKPEQLAKITTPVAISDGEHDEAIRQEHNVEMAKAIPGAELIILPGASHFAFWQKPDEFNAAVVEYLAKK